MGRYRDRMRVLVAAGVVGMVLLAGCATSATPATGGGGGGGATIGTTSIQGVGTVLVAPDGVTLYHLTTESGGSIQCTGSCEGVWPPLLESGGALPAEGAGVTGQLSTVTRPDGKVQVTYDGLPLYTYSGDAQAGQANGQGIQGVWYAVTPAGASSPSGGGRGYGGGGY